MNFRYEAIGIERYEYLLNDTFTVQQPTFDSIAFECQTNGTQTMRWLRIVFFFANIAFIACAWRILFDCQLILDEFQVQSQTKIYNSIFYQIYQCDMNEKRCTKCAKHEQNKKIKCIRKFSGAIVPRAFYHYCRSMNTSNETNYQFKESQWQI